MSIEHIMSGRGAKSTVYVWGAFRGVQHLYRTHVYTADVSMTNYVTLCGKARTPKGMKTWEQLGHPPEACTKCIQQYLRERT